MSPDRHKKSAGHPHRLSVIRDLGPRPDGAVFGPELDFWESGEVMVIGVDEAGRGPLAGPVVAAAVAFQSGTSIPGVGDSKLLTRSQRETADLAIREHSLACAVCSADHALIDRANILEATRLAMAEAVRHVARELSCKQPVLLVDGIIPPLRIGRQHNLIHGDSLSFSIGAASILAKVARDNLMRDFDTEFPEYGFRRNMGYPTAFHRSQLLSHGRCPIHRTTFTIAGYDFERIAIADLPLRVNHA